MTKIEVQQRWPLGREQELKRDWQRKVQGGIGESGSEHTTYMPSVG